MKRVRIFWNNNMNDLEKEINNWLERYGNYIDVINISISVAVHGHDEIIYATLLYSKKIK